MRLGRMRRYATVVLLLTQLLAVVASPVVASVSPPLHSSAAASIDTTPLRDAVTASGILTHLRAFQRFANENRGTRASGTSGYDASAQYVAAQLTAAGYVVTSQQFSFAYEAVEAGSARTGNSSFSARPMKYSPDTPVGGITGPLAIVPADGDATPGCEASDFAGINFTGTIALIKRGSCTLSVKAINASSAGASGVLIYNNASGPYEGSLGSVAEARVPTGSISDTDGAALTNLGAGITVTLELRTIREQRTTTNIIAETPTGDDAVVMVGAHLDSLPDGPGINDNGSGSAAILEVARQFAALGQPPKHKLRFAFWGAKERDLAGSQYYVNQLSNTDRSKIALYLDFDTIGSPNYARFVYDGDDSLGGGPTPPGSGEIEAVFANYFTSRGLSSEQTPLNNRSDHSPFTAVNIPAGGLFSGANGIKTAQEASIYGGTAGVAYDSCYHQACDTINNVSTLALAEMGDAIAHATMTLAFAGPTVTGVAPATLPTSGGRTVTISGSDFAPTATVTIGGTPCPIVSNAPTQIVCTAPSRPAGPADLIVTNPGALEGRIPTTIPGAFGYQPLTVAGITPNSGPAVGGTAVTIAGTGFAPNATATIGIAPCQGVVVNATGSTINCTTPPGFAGASDVVVTNPDNTATLRGGFTYLSTPQAVYTPTDLAFGNQQVGTTSRPLTVTLRNNGTGTLDVAGVTLAGANAGEFAIVAGSDRCTGAALAFDQTCTVAVTFTPTAPEARGAALTFTTNSGNVARGQQQVLIAGTGTAAPTSPPSASPSPTSYLITVSSSGPGTVSAGSGSYQDSTVATFTAAPNSGAVLIGWTVDNQFVGFGNPLTFTVTRERTVVATFAQRAAFSDLASNDGDLEAITQLATRGIINPTGISGSGVFQPDRPIYRVEVAALIARTFGWDEERHTNPFPDRCDPRDGGCLDDELWNDVAALAFYGIILGYPDAATCGSAGTTAPCFLPRNVVTQAQAISLITRAFGVQKYWTGATSDTGIYPNVPTGSAHRLDIITYVQQAGAIPGYPTNGAFTGYEQPASRRFVAAALWQAYSAYFSVNRLP